MVHDDHSLSINLLVKCHCRSLKESVLQSHEPDCKNFQMAVMTLATSENSYFRPLQKVLKKKF